MEKCEEACVESQHHFQKLRKNLGAQGKKRVRIA